MPHMTMQNGNQTLAGTRFDDRTKAVGNWPITYPAVKIEPANV
jgi:hypothetical protein